MASELEVLMVRGVGVSLTGAIARWRTAQQSFFFSLPVNPHEVERMRGNLSDALLFRAPDEGFSWIVSPRRDDAAAATTGFVIDLAASRPVLTGLQELWVEGLLPVSRAGELHSQLLRAGFLLGPALIAQQQKLGTSDDDLVRATGVPKDQLEKLFNSLLRDPEPSLLRAVGGALHLTLRQCYSLLGLLPDQGIGRDPILTYHQGGLHDYALDDAIRAVLNTLDEEE